MKKKLIQKNLTDEKSEPEIKITGITPAKPRPRKPKPITVASTPMIGNYQLPPMDFLQHADMTHQADRIEGGTDVQRAAHAADARAV